MPASSKTEEVVESGRRLAPEDRRNHLLGVALETFAERGYSDTDLNAIADAAGVQRTLLYHYFGGGKEDVYMAVLEHAWAELAAELTVDPERGRQLMPANLQRYLDLVEAEDPRVIVVRQSRRLDLARVAETTRLASAAMARGMAANQLGLDKPPEDLLAVLQAYLGFYEILLDEWMAGRLTRDQLETVMIETLPGVAAAAQRAAQTGR